MFLRTRLTILEMIDERIAKYHQRHHAHKEPSFGETLRYWHRAKAENIRLDELAETVRREVRLLGN